MKQARYTRRSVTSTNVGAHRAEELRASCATLGIGEPVFLGFHDSARKERQRHDDPRALANVDMLEVEAAVRRVIADVTPHVIITFDPHGGYYHPDHIAVHRATTAAFFSSGGLGADAPDRLLYRRSPTQPIEPTRRRVVAGASRTVLIRMSLLFARTPSRSPSTRRPIWIAMLAAFAAHQSAFGVTTEMFSDPPPDAARILRAFRPIMEHAWFVLAGVRGAVPQFPLRDVFDGLEIVSKLSP